MADKKEIRQSSLSLPQKKRATTTRSYAQKILGNGGQGLTGTVYGDGNNKKHGNDIKIAYYYNTRPNTQQMGPAAAAAATLLRIVVLFPIFPTIYSWRGGISSGMPKDEEQDIESFVDQGDELSDE